MVSSTGELSETELFAARLDQPPLILPSVSRLTPKDPDSKDVDAVKLLPEAALTRLR